MDIPKQTKELNKQYYPNGRAWNYARGSEQVNTEITRFVDGLNNPFVDGQGNYFIAKSSSEASPSKRLVNAFLKTYEQLYADCYSLLNQILADNDGFDETDASNWERVFGLGNNGLTLDQRKANILRKQSYPNGVAERGHYLFIQEQLRQAGYDVYVHENRFSDGGSSWVTVDPATLQGDIGDTTYTGDTNDFSSTLIFSNGISLNNDGSKMYIVGVESGVNFSVYEYDLTTNYLLSSATLSNMYDIEGQMSEAYSIRFRQDGFVMYIIGKDLVNSDRRIYRYNLTTPWDTTTASYTGDDYITTETNAMDFHFNTSGTKLFILDEANSTINQYNVTTSWDLNSIVSAGLSFDFSPPPLPTTVLRKFYINDIGNSLIIGGASNQLFQYNIANVNDISTSIYINSYTAQSNCEGIYIKSTNDQLFTLGEENVYKYDYEASEVELCANYIDVETDLIFNTIEPTIPVESGIYESGDIESGNTSDILGTEKLRAHFFIGGEIFPDRSTVSIDRKNNFRELILKLKPAQTVADLLIDYV